MKVLFLVTIACHSDFVLMSIIFHLGGNPGHSRHTSLSVMSKASQLSLCPPTHFAHSLVTLLSCLIGILDNPVVAYENGEGTTSNDHPGITS